MTGWHIIGRRAFIGLTLATALGLGLSGLSGCGWAPLYADRETGPADQELRAIRVGVIPERIGQKLALALRESLNPTGEATPQRYVLNTRLQTVRSDLGVLSLGLGTRARLDVYGSFFLNDTKTGNQIMAGTSHVAESFDILANEYATIVAEGDAGSRAVEQLRRDIIARLNIFMQRRAAERVAKPATP